MRAVNFVRKAHQLCAELLNGIKLENAWEPVHGDVNNHQNLCECHRQSQLIYDNITKREMGEETLHGGVGNLQNLSEYR